MQLYEQDKEYMADLYIFRFFYYEKDLDAVIIISKLALISDFLRLNQKTLL
jgi:hypothetical protein